MSDCLLFNGLPSEIIPEEEKYYLFKDGAFQVPPTTNNGWIIENGLLRTSRYESLRYDNLLFTIPATTNFPYATIVFKNNNSGLINFTAEKKIRISSPTENISGLRLYSCQPFYASGPTYDFPIKFIFSASSTTTFAINQDCSPDTAPPSNNSYLIKEIYIEKKYFN